MPSIGAILRTRPIRVYDAEVVMPSRGVPFCAGVAVLAGMLACGNSKDGASEPDPGSSGGGASGQEAGAGGQEAGFSGQAAGSNGQAGAATGGAVWFTSSEQAGSATEAGPAVIEEDAACLSESHAGERLPINLLFMVDVTGSTRCRTGQDAPRTCPHPEDWSGTGPTRLQVEIQGIKDFVSNPANSGIGVGVSFFPKNIDVPGLGGVCDRSVYETPAVEVGPLPGNGPAIVAALESQTPNGGTPTQASVEGALNHAAVWAAQAAPDTAIALVYVTDGEPEGCIDVGDIDAAARSAATAFGMGIPTYVLGVGPLLENLNKLALAGGTSAAYLLDVSAANGTTPAEQFAAALESIRSRAVRCDYRVPTVPDGGRVDPAKVNVRAHQGDGEAVLQIVQVADEAACSENGGGWYYKDGNTVIVLCKETCAPLRAEPSSSVEILLGCKTITAVPK